MTGPILMAVYPPRGNIVHLYLPGYRPGLRTRSIVESAMCGASANESVPPPVGPAPTGRILVPLGDAINSEAFTQPRPLDPRPQWRWCKDCLGHAVVHYDIWQPVMGQLVEITKGKTV